MNPKNVREIALHLLALVIVVGTISFLVLLAVRETPAGNKDALTLALGAFLTAFGTVVGYFFGSSKGSADKNDLLKKDDPNQLNLPLGTPKNTP